MRFKTVRFPIVLLLINTFVWGVGEANTTIKIKERSESGGSITLVVNPYMTTTLGAITRDPLLLDSTLLYHKNFSFEGGVTYSIYPTVGLEIFYKREIADIGLNAKTGHIEWNGQDAPEERLLFKLKYKF